MLKNSETYVPSVMLVDVEVVVPLDRRGKPLITPADELRAQHACDFLLYELEDLSRFVTRFSVRFPLDDKRKVVQWVGITAFIIRKEGGETHFTKWFRRSEPLTEILPTRQEIAAGLLEPLRQFIPSRA